MKGKGLEHVSMICVRREFRRSGSGSSAVLVLASNSTVLLVRGVSHLVRVTWPSATMPCQSVVAPEVVS